MFINKEISKDQILIKTSDLDNLILLFIYLNSSYYLFLFLLWVPNIKLFANIQYQTTSPFSRKIGRFIREIITLSSPFMLSKVLASRGKFDFPQAISSSVFARTITELLLRRLRE